MKNVYLSFWIVTALLTGASAFADTSVNANHVSGFDKIMGSDATDCRYASISRPNKPGMLSIYVNSDSAEYVNSHVDIPKSLLPLQDGKDYANAINGVEMSYADGVLTLKYSENPGLGGLVNTSMTIGVSNDLNKVTQASVSKKDRGGFLGLERTAAQIDCSFP